MNQALARLADETGLALPDREPLRLAFGHACAMRVRHLLEDDRAAACLDVLGDHLAGRAGRAGSTALHAAAREAAAVAGSHRGSNSIDGSAHAAVSAAYAVANAAAGRALDAAGYAADAAVYAYGGYAVSDASAFEPEVAWQTGTLRALAARASASASTPVFTSAPASASAFAPAAGSSTSTSTSTSTSALAPASAATAP